MECISLCAWRVLFLYVYFVSHAVYSCIEPSLHRLDFFLEMFYGLYNTFICMHCSTILTLFSNNCLMALIQCSLILSGQMDFLYNTLHTCTNKLTIMFYNESLKTVTYINFFFKFFKLSTTKHYMTNNRFL